MTEKASKSQEPFLNRELSWIEFNRRVLEESLDPGTPLLERFRFAAIFSSNLDEFFMVRVAGLKNRLEAGDVERDPAGLTPRENLSEISTRVHAILLQLDEHVQKTLLPAGEEQGIVLYTYENLTADQKTYFENRFETEIFPVLTPMAIDPTHPFPILINLGLNLAVELAPAGSSPEPRLAVVPLPSVLPRLYPLHGEKLKFVPIEEIVKRHILRLFAGQEILQHALFRITRDAELEFDDEGSVDLMETLESELHKRRTNPVVRFEVDQGIPPKLLETFHRLLDIREEDVYLAPRFLDYRFLSGIADLSGLEAQKFRPLPPQLPPEFEDRDRLWPLLREQDVVLHHPYDSFEPVIQFVSQAASDPDVLAIKQTLYRTSGDSPMVRALAQAAQNGKQVTVLVELMARFDEERNITWAKQLERAGAHVIYGLVGLKTHAKILLVIRREKDGIRRYVHLGTGNYNDRTARQYTDIGLLTGDDALGADASGFFNTITGYSDPPEFRKLVMAPLALRQRFLHWIHREKSRAESGARAVIVAKMNSLVDRQIIEALCEASQAGVEVKLAVRGICCLRPGVKGVSERIRVVSIIDRFLEHSRLFYFLNGGEEEFYGSSADWMSRNLDRRVELLFPIESAEGREKIRVALDLCFSDNVKARVLQPDGSYQFRKRKKNEEPIRLQEKLYELAVRNRERPRTPQFKPQSVPPQS